MKKLRILFLAMGFLAMAISISSCANEANTSEKQGKEYTSAYVCPMHCETSGSKEPGKCPVCGMDYVKNKDHKSEDHKH